MLVIGDIVRMKEDKFEEEITGFVVGLPEVFSVNNLLLYRIQWFDNGTISTEHEAGIEKIS